MPTKARLQKESDKSEIEALFSNVPEDIRLSGEEAMVANADLLVLVKQIEVDDEEYEKQRLLTLRRKSNAKQKADAVIRLHDFAARHRNLILKDKSARWVAQRIKDTTGNERSVATIARDVRRARELIPPA